MIRLLACTAMVLLFSALVLLAVDRNIYRTSGWVRDSKYAAVTGWTCTGAAGLILAGLLIYM
ncbi:hypothetical protein R70723_06295 [Paenibacillus sp. FSL R7-0273]|uniref:CLC_0170 family protein n=1 Tax=Paenibacillus sp. FSL R7-0273 TaxID=1536772 RepID=UPI0004F65E90|nr:CLC_0170 family protein [Paenibacillus sp. FSL R7-0273]AIQ45549.1 hypothetical protein R70723_06295 [Paenibacillus sp. FSL R7-0273]OMF84894.1 hypothetical protein BK144_29185 [Paenibacillus sp. FSL R7-0273]